MRLVHITKAIPQYVNCDVCGKRVIKRTIRDHILRHENALAYRHKCFVCGKGFLFKDKLRVKHQTKEYFPTLKSTSLLEPNVLENSCYRRTNRSSSEVL